MPMVSLPSLVTESGSRPAMSSSFSMLETSKPSMDEDLDDEPVSVASDEPESAASDVPQAATEKSMATLARPAASVLKFLDNMMFLYRNARGSG